MYSGHWSYLRYAYNAKLKLLQPFLLCYIRYTTPNMNLLPEFRIANCDPNYPRLRLNCLPIEMDASTWISFHPVIIAFDASNLYKANAHVQMDHRK